MVGQLLTILQVESIQLDQIGLLGIGVDGQPGKMGHACVAELPAGAKGECVQVGEGAGQQEQAGVGDDPSPGPWPPIPSALYEW